MSDGGAAPTEELVAWCRAVEDRLAGAQAEKTELFAENERLRARVAELTAILKGIEEAYLLGKLRAAGMIAPAPEPPPPPAPARQPAAPRRAQPKTEILQALVQPPKADAAESAGADGEPESPGPVPEPKS